MKELMIEITLLIIHIIFVLISIFEFNMEIRIYFDSLAFFAMLISIFIEMIFSISNTIIEIISCIISFFQNLRNDKPKKKKNLSYKNDLLKLKISRNGKHKSASQNKTPQTNNKARLRNIPDKCRRKPNKKGSKKQQRPLKNNTIINVKPCENTNLDNINSSNYEMNKRNIASKVKESKKEKASLKVNKNEEQNSSKTHSNDNLQVFKPQIIHQDLSQIKQFNENVGSLEVESIDDNFANISNKKPDLRPVPIIINVERKLDSDMFERNNQIQAKNNDLIKPKLESIEEEKSIPHQFKLNIHSQNESFFNNPEMNKKIQENTSQIVLFTRWI